MHWQDLSFCLDLKTHQIYLEIFKQTRLASLIRTESNLESDLFSTQCGKTQNIITSWTDQNKEKYLKEAMGAQRNMQAYYLKYRKQMCLNILFSIKFRSRLQSDSTLLHYVKTCNHVTRSLKFSPHERNRGEQSLWLIAYGDEQEKKLTNYLLCQTPHSA